MLSLALLEVTDKEPPLPWIWFTGLVLGGIGFWSARRWLWPALPIIAYLAVDVLSAHEEITDRFVGPAIVEEAGRGYIVQSYLLPSLAIAATVVGLVWGIARWWRRRAGRGQSAAPGAVPVN